MSDEPSNPAPTPSGTGPRDDPSGAGAMPTGGAVHWLPGSGNTFGVVVAVIAVGGLVVLAGPSLPSAGGLAALTSAAFVALAGWVVLVRPRVGLRQRAQRGAEVPVDLVLRGMVSAVSIPLAAVTSVDVRQTLVVHAGDRLWHSTALGRSRRELTRGKRRPGDTAAGFVVRTGPWGSLNAPDAQRPGGAPAPSVAEVVLGRIERARQDAAVHRVPSGPVARSWAWLEIAALVLLGVVSGVLFAV
ncbi:hypothetical protein [Nocardioides fonticola]|uniref:hypothetical protein n=1 Tax=Nocardioides fonticola TaxID=450363 RepID=UPI0031E21180